MRMEDPLARLGNLAQLIEKHAPYLHLHPSESHKTGAFEDYLADRGVYYGPPRNGHPVPSPLPEGKNSRGGYLYCGNSDPQLRKGDLDRTRTYVHALEHQVWGKDQPPGIALQFWFWYPYTGPATGRISLRLKIQLPTKIRICWPPWKSRVEDKTVLDHSFSGTIGLNPLGEREGDWEQATLFFDHEQSLKMIRCHDLDGHTDYFPGDWDDRNGRPVLYAALNGHPVFPKPGEYPTLVASDADRTPIKASRSVFFNLDAAKVRGDVKVTLINDCRAGPAVDCAATARVVAVTTSLADGPLRDFQGPPAPHWLWFQGRAGDAEPSGQDDGRKFAAEFARNFSDAFTDPVDHILPGAVRILANGIARDIVGGIARRVAPSIYKDIGKARRTRNVGPRMPAGNAEWRPDWQAE